MSTRLPDLAALALLCAVEEHGSLSAAASRLGIAQPNASRTMTRLEAELGLRLLDRGPRGSALTRNGALVAEWAADALDAAHRFRTATATLQNERGASLSVAASQTVAEALMPHWLSSLRAEQPALAIHLRVCNSDEVVESVSSGESDVGFVESPRVRGNLRHVEVARDRLVVIVAPQHPWAHRRRPVTAAELARVALVVREPGSGTRTTLDAALVHEERVPPTLELDSNAAVRVSVASGAGVAVLSELAVASAVRSGELIVVPAAIELPRRMRAVWLPGPVRDEARELVAIARRSHAWS